jgi:hypothetical protein
MGVQNPHDAEILWEPPGDNGGHVIGSKPRGSRSFWPFGRARPGTFNLGVVGSSPTGLTKRSRIGVAALLDTRRIDA